jgi:DNA-binding CsgD family transcriptional regulator
LTDASLPSFDEDDLTRVRSRIYESIGDLDELPGALMAAGRRLNAAHVAICSPTLDARLGHFNDALSTNFDVSSAQSFAIDSGTLDPWTEGMLGKFGARPGLILLGDQLTPRDAVLKSPWQSGFFIPNDVGDLLLATLRPVDAYDAPVAMLGFFRSRRSPRFEPDAADRLALFVRDLERMARVALTLRAHRNEKVLLRAALDRAVEAFLIVRADLKVVFANAAAESMLDGGEDLAVRNGKLAADGCDKLDAAIRSAIERAEGSDIAIAREGKRPLLATIAPAPGEMPERLGANAVAILVISDPERPIADPKAISQAFALSEAEAHLAHQISRGSSVAEFAARYAVSESTVRRQFESILRKLALTNGADLVRLLSARPTSRGPQPNEISPDAQ